MSPAEQKRAEARKARRLAGGMTDPALVATLQTYAAECDAAAVRLESEASEVGRSGKPNGA
jgi:hypothetical protein